MQLKRKALSNSNKLLLPLEIAEAVSDMSRSCENKFTYEVGEAADAAAYAISVHKRSEYFIAYQCRFGLHFHVGHATFADYVEIGGLMVASRDVFLNGEVVPKSEVARLASLASQERLNVAKRTFNPSSASVGDRVPPVCLAGYGKMYRFDGRSYVEGPSGDCFMLRGQDYERIK